MEKNRILVIGCCGSGKSTLSKQLGTLLHLPVVHLDQLFWHPGWVEASREEFDQKLAQELQREQWIMDGNFARTLPLRLQRADMVVFLDFPAVRCVWGVIKRVVTTHGTVRDDMGEGCPERFDWDFLLYTWRFNRRHREKLETILQAHPTIPVVRLKNRRAVKMFLQRCA